MCYFLSDRISIIGAFLIFINVGTNPIIAEIIRAAIIKRTCLIEKPKMKCVSTSFSTKNLFARLTTRLDKTKEKTEITSIKNNSMTREVKLIERKE